MIIVFSGGAGAQADKQTLKISAARYHFILLITTLHSQAYQLISVVSILIYPHKVADFSQQKTAFIG